MANITACIITLNEEDYIRGCLESVKWVDEIVIVDSYSDDDTVEIAEEYTDNIFQSDDYDGFDGYRKIAVDKASNEWILEIDADERVSQGLKEELKTLADSEFDYIKAPRKNYRFGKWIKDGDSWPDYTPVMYKKSKVQLSSELHDFNNPKENAKMKYINPVEKNAILHFSFLGTEDIIDRANRYTSIEVNQSNAKASFFGLFFKPIYSFLRRYLYKKGYRNGIGGFLVCLLHSVSKILLEIKRFERKYLGDEEEYLNKYREIDKKNGWVNK